MSATRAPLRRASSVSSVSIALTLALAATACAPNRGAAYEKSMTEARRAYAAGRYEAAAEAYDAAARTAKVPRDAALMRYEAALARARAGDVARASRELRAIAAEQPPGPYAAEASFKAADLAYRSAPARGRAELEAMALAFPSHGVARVALLRVVADEAEAGGDAAALAKLEALAPRTKKTELEETVAYERAKRLSALGRTEEARDAFLDVAHRFPYPFGNHHDDALYRASEEDEKLGDPRRAIAHLEELLSVREKAHLIGSYERPRYRPAIERIAALYENVLHDRAKAREALHRLYADFDTSLQRDDALFHEARLFREDGDARSACDRLRTLVREFPDSRYVPCAAESCGIERPSKSRAPTTCHDYLRRKDGSEG